MVTESLSVHPSNRTVGHNPFRAEIAFVDGEDAGFIRIQPPVQISDAALDLFSNDEETLMMDSFFHGQDATVLRFTVPRNFYQGMTSRERVLLSVGKLVDGLGMVASREVFLNNNV
jgi:hypothetical protein